VCFHKKVINPSISSGYLTLKANICSLHLSMCVSLRSPFMCFTMITDTCKQSVPGLRDSVRLKKRRYTNSQMHTRVLWMTLRLKLLHDTFPGPVTYSLFSCVSYLSFLPTKDKIGYTIIEVCKWRHGTSVLSRTEVISERCNEITMQVKWFI